MTRSDALLARFLALHPKSIDLSLDRVQRLLEGLGHPERRLPPVIHVAGTNGKGSTIAFMRAILEAAGQSVHVYTSPHLVRFHERIRLGARGERGRFVDEAVLVEAFRACEAANDGGPITHFEITTAAALLLFAEHPADALLLEVGLGGRLDTTNVVNRPAATVVTPVSMDHADYLGDSVALIAREKAGIFKRGVPAIVAQQGVESAAVLDAAAERARAPLLLGGQDFHVREENGRLVYEDDRGLLDLPPPRLAGRHQFVNAGTAIAALRHARLAGGGHPFADLPTEAYERGMREPDWPARLQRVAAGRLLNLLPRGAELWLDGSHNEEGGRVTAAAMADLEDRAGKPLLLVVGMLSTKDVGAFLRPFAGLAKEALTVPIGGQVAARPAEEVAALARGAGLQAEAAPGVEAALDEIGRRVWGVAPRVLITGSLYLAGEVLAANGTPPV